MSGNLNVNKITQNGTTKVSNTRKTASYNGKTYDVLTSYLNDSQILSFDYTLLPENYTYDKTNEEEIAAVNEIEQKQNEQEGRRHDTADQQRDIIPRVLHASPRACSRSPTRRRSARGSAPF